MADTNSRTLRQNLESLIVRELERSLRENQIAGERAQEVAKIVLATVPSNITDSELMRILPMLDDKAPELAPVVYKILSEKDERDRTQQLDHLRNMIRSMKNG